MTLTQCESESISPMLAGTRTDDVNWKECIHDCCWGTDHESEDRNGGSNEEDPTDTERAERCKDGQGDDEGCRADFRSNNGEAMSKHSIATNAYQLSGNRKDSKFN